MLITITTATPPVFDHGQIERRLTTTMPPGLAAHVGDRLVTITADDAEAVTTEALAAIDAAIAAYTYTPTRYALPLELTPHAVALSEAIAALGLPGFAGITASDGLWAEFPLIDAPPTEGEAAALDMLLANFVPPPDWGPVRAEVAGRLAESQPVLDLAEDREDAAMVSAIRAYRLAVRGATDAPDPASVTWPARPWLA